MLLYPESLLLLHIVRKLPSVHPMNKRQEMMASNSCVYDRNVVGSGPKRCDRKSIRQRGLVPSGRSDDTDDFAFATPATEAPRQL